MMISFIPSLCFFFPSGCLSFLRSFIRYVHCIFDSLALSFYHSRFGFVPYFFLCFTHVHFQSEPRVSWACCRCSFIPLNAHNIGCLLAIAFTRSCGSMNKLTSYSSLACD